MVVFSGNMESRVILYCENEGCVEGREAGAGVNERVVVVGGRRSDGAEGF